MANHAEDHSELGALEAGFIKSSVRKEIRLSASTSSKNHHVPALRRRNSDEPSPETQETRVDNSPHPQYPKDFVSP